MFAFWNCNLFKLLFSFCLVISYLLCDPKRILSILRNFHQFPKVFIHRQQCCWLTDTEFNALDLSKKLQSLHIFIGLDLTWIKRMGVFMTREKLIITVLNSQGEESFHLSIVFQTHDFLVPERYCFCNEKLVLWNLVVMSRRTRSAA